MMDKKTYSELKRNTIIIAISNLGSKAISFILAPLYSYYMTTAEYGTMDLITTTVGLLFPFVCIDIFEATFRFANDQKYNEKTVLSTSLFIWGGENIIIWVSVLIFAILYKFSLIILVCIFSASLDSIYQILAQFARGRGKMKIFALSGIVNSIVLLFLNIIFMIFLSYGLNGWIISFVVAKLLAVWYLSISINIFENVKIKYIDKTFLKEAIKFCLPLMPSASMWWIMNASDRYIISFYLGVSATGIYAVANKIPVILSVFENVFYQSWQTTAINTMNTEDRDKVYSLVFLKYFQILTVGVIAILLFLKPLIIYLFAKEYHYAWISAAILLICVMFHALAGNLGTLYTVFKNTTGALKTSAIGAGVNIILNLLFIKFFGMNAAAWTTLAAYIVVLIIRWYDISKNVQLKIPIFDVSVYIFCLMCSLVLYYIDNYFTYVFKILIFVFILYRSKNIILGIIRK